MPAKRILLITCAAAAMTLTMRSPSDATGPGAYTPVLSGALTTSADPPRGPETSIPAKAATMSGAAGQDDGAVDVGALRYFAAEKNAGRVDAEIRLLRKTHPDFQPPEDLYSDGQGSGDEQALWDLYAKHDLAGLRARMDDLRRSDATWHPSRDLAGKLALAEAREVLVKASDEKRWADVIGTATGNKGLLTCGDPDALWRTAEALAQTGDEARALAAYRYVLATCDGGAIRTATVQKAGLTLRSPASFEQLLAMGRPRPDGHGEFETARLDQIRQTIGAAAAGTGNVEPSQAQIDGLAAVAETPAGPTDAQMLGWFYYARADYPSAQRWFRTALKTDRNAKSAEGLVLSLRSANDNAGAREAAMTYEALDVPNRKLMLEVLAANLTDPGAKPLTTDEMTALTRAVDEYKSQDGAQSLSIYATNRKDRESSKAWNHKFTQWKGEEIESMRSAEGAEALGWLLYQGNEVAEADAWFKKSADWAPSESAAVGLLVTSHRLHHDKDYAKWVAQYRAIYPQVAQLASTMQSHVAPARVARIVKRLTRVAQDRIVHRKTRVASGGDWDQSATNIVTAAQSGRYDDAMALLDQRRRERPEPRGLSVVRGWVLYHRGQWDDAKQVFSNLDNGSYSPERREGLRVVEYSYMNPHFR